MIRRTIVLSSLLCLAACAKQSGDPAPAEAKPAAETKTAALAPAAEAPAKAEAAADPHAGLAQLQVDEVAQLIEAKKIVAVDSNGTDTRKKYGTLPGAVLLSSSGGYELSELPEDKGSDLVFYCGSEQCSAAPKAAARAEKAGYTSVKVMPAGIRGWVKAGKPVVEQS